MPQSTNIEDNIRQLQKDIAHYSHQYSRTPASTLLLAVSKTQPAESIQQAFHAGQKDFGENYLQEALTKISQLQTLDINWHFIGSIQSNKTRELANHFQWIHSVDRLKIARRLSEQRDPKLAPLNICLQINAASETSKSGISLDELPDMAQDIAQLPNLKLRGLMSIPIKADSLEQQREIFKPIADAMKQLNQRDFDMDTLSMGMSNDMEAAIAEGATIVRIGSAIFGTR